MTSGFGEGSAVFGRAGICSLWDPVVATLYSLIDVNRKDLFRDRAPGNDRCGTVQLRTLRLRSAAFCGAGATLANPFCDLAHLVGILPQLCAYSQASDIHTITPAGVSLRC